MSDLIDKQALLDKVAEWEAQALHMCEMHMNDDDPSEWRKWSYILTERSAFKYDVQDAPTVDPVKHGKWISTQNPDWPAYWHDVCSECGWENMKDVRIGRGKKSKALNFCPACGAKMDLSDSPTGCDGANPKEEVSMEVSEDDG